MGQEHTNILLVEDRFDDMEMIKRKFMSRNIKCKLLIVRNGEDVLEYLCHKEKYSDNGKFNDIKLIILDIRIPKINGFEVLRMIKSDKTLKKIPVVILTASTASKDILESFDIGCEHYIAKSVGFEKFEKTLEPIIKHYLRK